MKASLKPPCLAAFIVEYDITDNLAVQDGEKKRVHDLAREAREDDTMDCEVSAWVLVAIRLDQATIVS